MADKAETSSPADADSQRQGSSKLWIVAVGLFVALAILIGVLIAMGWGDDEYVVPAGAIPAEQVVEDPDRYRFAEITVAGQVDVMTDRLLTLGESDLIVASVGAPTFEDRGFFVGDPVYATGVVRLLNADQLQQELPPTELVPSAFEDFDRQPVLFATEVVPAAGVEEDGFFGDEND